LLTRCRFVRVKVDQWGGNRHRLTNRAHHCTATRQRTAADARLISFAVNASEASASACTSRTSPCDPHTTRMMHGLGPPNPRPDRPASTRLDPSALASTQPGASSPLHVRSRRIDPVAVCRGPALVRVRIHANSPEGTSCPVTSKCKQACCRIL
jgi:hypothetical protein